MLPAYTSFPAILLTGARQVGKSTLAQQLISPSWNARYVTLDDRANLDAALRDPDGFVDALPTPTILDEVQRAPAVLLSLKRAIDRKRSPGSWLLIDIGRPSQAFPVTPPCIRVRTRRFGEKSRSHYKRRETKRIEESVGQRMVHAGAMTQPPRPMRASCRLRGQDFSDSPTP